MSRRRRSIVPALLLAAALAPGARAQQYRLPRVHAVELTFSAGYLQPTGAAGQTGGGVSLERKPSWEAGVHFGAYAKNGLWGGEVSAGYTPERVSHGGQGSRRSHLTYGTAKFLVGKSPRKPGISVMGGAGLSVMRRKKSLPDPEVSKSSMGGVLSLMLRFPLDDQVGLRLDGENLIYRADFGTGSKLRNDFILTLGLGISW